MTSHLLSLCSPCLSSTPRHPHLTSPHLSFIPHLILSPCIPLNHAACANVLVLVVSPAHALRPACLRPASFPVRSAVLQVYLSLLPLTSFLYLSFFTTTSFFSPLYTTRALQTFLRLSFPGPPFLLLYIYSIN